MIADPEANYGHADFLWHPGLLLEYDGMLLPESDYRNIHAGPSPEPEKGPIREIAHGVCLGCGVEGPYRAKRMCGRCYFKSIRKKAA